MQRRQDNNLNARTEDDTKRIPPSLHASLAKRDKKNLFAGSCEEIAGNEMKCLKHLICFFKGHVMYESIFGSYGGEYDLIETCERCGKKRVREER